MALPTTIINHHKTNTYTAYDVLCFNHHVRTIVTRCPVVVTSWINHIESIHHPLTIIGLDTEWFDPIATLQLCVGSNCLIYQLLYTSSIPSKLDLFLRDIKLKFSGVGVSGDSHRLFKDYNLQISNVVDVSKVAAEAGRVRVNAGLKEVAKVVLGWEMVKNKEITRSEWNKEVLDEGQVLYACMDAFVSYYIGKELIIGQDCDVDVDHKLFGELEAIGE